MGVCSVHSWSHPSDCRPGSGVWSGSLIRTGVAAGQSAEQEKVVLEHRHVLMQGVRNVEPGT